MRLPLRHHCASAWIVDLGGLQARYKIGRKKDELDGGSTSRGATVGGDEIELGMLDDRPGDNDGDDAMHQQRHRQTLPPITTTAADECSALTLLLSLVASSAPLLEKHKSCELGESVEDDGGDMTVVGG